MKQRIDATFHHPNFAEFLGKLGNGRFEITEIKQLLDINIGIRYGTGTPPPIVEPNEKSQPFIRATDIKENQILLGGLLHIDSVQPQHMQKCRVKAGEMILVRSGVNTGDCAIVPSQLDGSYAAYDLILRFNPGVLPEYVSSFLDTTVGRIQMNVRKGRAAQPHINADEVSSIKIPLPPLDVQRALVAEMEAARAARLSKLAEAENLLKGMDGFVLEQLGLKVPKEEKRISFGLCFSQIKDGRVDPYFHHPTFSNLLENIQAIPHKRLGQIAQFSGETWSQEEEQAETFRYIEISGVDIQTGNVAATETFVSEAPTRARMVVRNGDILVSLTRPHRGAIAQVDESLDNCVASTGFSVIREIIDENVTKDYLWCVLRNRISLQQMLQRSSGGNYPAITEPELKQILIPVPSQPIQKAIADELSRRREAARCLRVEAGQIWQDAKEKFEKALLG